MRSGPGKDGWVGGPLHTLKLGDVICQEPATLFGETMSPFVLEPAGLARLLVICLPLPPQQWGYKCIPAHSRGFVLLLFAITFFYREHTKLC